MIAHNPLLLSFLLLVPVAATAAAPWASESCPPSFARLSSAVPTRGLAADVSDLLHDRNDPDYVILYRGSVAAEQKLPIYPFLQAAYGRANIARILRNAPAGLLESNHVAQSYFSPFVSATQHLAIAKNWGAGAGRKVFRLRIHKSRIFRTEDDKDVLILGGLEKADITHAWNARSLPEAVPDPYARRLAPGQLRKLDEELGKIPSDLRAGTSPAEAVFRAQVQKTRSLAQQGPFHSDRHFLHNAKDPSVALPDGRLVRLSPGEAKLLAAARAAPESEYGLFRTVSLRHGEIKVHLFHGPFYFAEAGVVPLQKITGVPPQMFSAYLSAAELAQRKTLPDRLGREWVLRPYDEGAHRRALEAHAEAYKMFHFVDGVLTPVLMTRAP